VPFMFDCRLDSADVDVFRELAEAGLYQVFVGIETGSDERLAFYDKRYDVEYVRRRVTGLQDLGIEVIPGILTCHPSSTPEELRESLAVIDACGYVSTWQFLCDIFAHPGTTLWNQYRTAGWLREEWPVTTWEFQDERAKAVRDEVSRAVQAGGGHDEARAAFAGALARM
jgi:anaerobic magnesium-protoporphyrin IX monomethyl ester cyclase